MTYATWILDVRSELFCSQIALSHRTEQNTDKKLNKKNETDSTNWATTFRDVPVSSVAGWHLVANITMPTKTDLDRYRT